MPSILFWCDGTARMPFVTGIQRVVRRLATELQAAGVPVEPVGWDSQRRSLAGLPLAPRRALGFGDVGRLDIRPRTDGQPTWLLLPETPLAVREGLNPVALGRAYGFKVAAILHDLIPVKLAAHYMAGEQSFYASYFRNLAGADLIVTTTELVAADFRNFLRAEGLASPRIAVVPLGGDFSGHGRISGRPHSKYPSAALDEPLALLMVGSWEARKNHPRVLKALHDARGRTARPLTLTIVGRRGHDPAYDQAVLAQVQGLPGVTVKRWVPDAELVALYGHSHVSIYGSYEEGFGLPVLESLWMGVPCLCHAGSAMQAVGAGGGTLMADMLDETAITESLLRLAEPDGVLSLLTQEAAVRPIRSWRDFAQDLTATLTQVMSLESN